MTRAALVFFVLLRASAAAAQGDVDATLFVDPYPSPYISDGEVQAGMVTLTVTNGSVAQDLVVVLAIKDPQGRSIVNARGDPPTRTTSSAPADCPRASSRPA